VLARLANWKEIMDTAHLSADRQMDPVSKWLIITRATVFSMTLTSGFIGAMLAMGNAPESVNYAYLALAIFGLVIAHAANNIINDYFDLEAGIDTNDYVRAKYMPHPILAGMVTKAQLRLAILLLNAIDLGILVFLVIARGWPIAVFALLGLFISVFYVAPPIFLKKRGLGEPGVFLVWGPLMIGGTYFAATGALPGWVWIASLPYAILVTTVLMGKHIDKIAADGPMGIHTLPVILGERNARLLNATLMVAFYPIVLGAALVGLIGPWVAVVVLGLPLLWTVLKTYAADRPKEAPAGWVLWPLWYVSFAFVHTRRAGVLLVIGLFLNIVLPVKLPWLPA
jgi:1,4-dihydroxy-2-naphthoate octaprenyltransferase